MKTANRVKDVEKKVRTTINIDDDLHPDNSDKVRARMRKRRAANFSNYVDILVAEDTGLKSREVNILDQVPEVSSSPA